MARSKGVIEEGWVKQLFTKVQHWLGKQTRDAPYSRAGNRGGSGCTIIIPWPERQGERAVIKTERELSCRTGLSGRNWSREKQWCSPRSGIEGAQADLSVLLLSGILLVPLSIPLQTLLVRLPGQRAGWEGQRVVLEGKQSLSTAERYVKPDLCKRKSNRPSFSANLASASSLPHLRVEIGWPHLLYCCLCVAPF